MADITIDGFKFSQWPHGVQLLHVENNRLAACVNYCNEKQIQWLNISPSLGYGLTDLNFLRDCPHIVGIYMQSGFLDMRGLYGLKHLDYLSAIFPHQIDFSALPSLTQLATHWHAQIDKTLLAAKSLSRLSLWRYKPKSRDLTQLAALGNLAALHITQSPIVFLRGIESLHKLRRIGLSHCLVQNIKPLAKLAATLEELELDHCNQIPDLTLLEMLTNLRRAVLSNCGSVRSLKFIRKLPKLEFLSFAGTHVLDGDMTPCLDLRFADFVNREQYSHTREQVQHEIKRRKGSQSFPEPLAPIWMPCLSSEATHDQTREDRHGFPPARAPRK